MFFNVNKFISLNWRNIFWINKTFFNLKKFFPWPYNKETFLWFEETVLSVYTLSLDYFSLYSVVIFTRVEIALSFLISSWVLVGPGLEFPHLEKTSRGPVSTRLVFISVFIFVSGGTPTRESLFVIFVVKVRSIRYNITFILYSH